MLFCIMNSLTIFVAGAKSLEEVEAALKLAISSSEGSEGVVLSFR